MKELRRLLRWFVLKADWFWDWVSSVPALRTFVNWLFIKIIATSTPPRPHPFSLWGPGRANSDPAAYTSWTSLTDRSFTGRHLPPAADDWMAHLPDPSRVDTLFRRRHFTPCPSSSAFFCFFAQWFTDSFLRTDPNDLRKNTSNHEIDLCQIYGLSASDTAILRSGVCGKLKSQQIKGEEFPMYLFEDDGLAVRAEFLDLSYIDKSKRDYRNSVVPTEFDRPERKRTFFANGLELGNSTAFYTAINTVFLREHNRLCDEIFRENPAWDDDRLFETARNTNIVQLLKIIIEDYINHLSSTAFKLFVDIGSAERQAWYRTNRISAEFNLLYRWHALVPDECVVDTAPVPHTHFRFNNELLVDKGVERLVASASIQRAGKITLRNTPAFLMHAEVASLTKSRMWRLRSYNEYRKRFGLKPAGSFEDITQDHSVAAAIAGVYQHVDNVELIVGLLAEGNGDETVLGELMALMVGVDAFSQALTNPLLASAVFNEATFGSYGFDSVQKTSKIDQIVQRNTKMQGRRATFGVPRMPGSYGWWYLGTVRDTLDFFFFSGWKRFFTRRSERYDSKVFRVNLFKPTIVILDRDAMAPLFNSPLLRQDYGFSWAVPALPLVGHEVPSIFESGKPHDVPKKLYMAVLQLRLPTLLGTFHEVAERYGERWKGAPGFSFEKELEALSAEFLFRWYFDMQVDPDKVRMLYLNLFSHVFWRLTRYLPWSAFNRSLRLYEYLLQQLQAAPGFRELLPEARALGLHDDVATAKQMMFMTGMNSFLGLQNLSKSLIGELSLQPQLLEELRSEIEGVLGAAPPRQLSDVAPQRMPQLDRTLREIVRLHPPVTFIFGRAVQALEIQTRSGATYGIPQDSLLMGVLPLAMRDSQLYERPDTFDPSRFEAPAASDNLIWPRGVHDATVTASDRTCPGKDVAMEILRLLAVFMVQRYDWHLKEMPTWDERKFSLNVAAPVGKLQVRTFNARAAPDAGASVPEPASAA